ncbi:hypothetical protein [Sphingobacterium thalpophilum]|uniref:hypothetical protein n=1 Tax=Sphingobacterium thalpophilum TaxID=259 RepID=UPI002D7799D3|nr:hypothetical protein [Sphingobacterium thalpophilum]
MGFCRKDIIQVIEKDIKAYRYLNGLSRKHFGKLMEVDPQTEVGWENAWGKGARREKIERYFIEI